MSSRRAALILPLALTGGILSAMPADAACAGAPPRISLTDFSLQAPRLFYLGTEGQSADVTIGFAGGCAGASMSVHYATQPGTASAPGDYSHIADDETQSVPTEAGVEVSVPVPIIDDAADVDLIESFDFTLSNPQGGPGTATPSLGIASAPILIVDGDGVSRVGFEGIPYSLSETYSVASIPVFRGGDVSAPASVAFTVAPDPAAAPTPGQDYTAPASGTLTFSGTDRLQSIDVGIINDKLGEGPETLVLTLSDPSTGTTIENGQAEFTILDNEESEFPRSRLHHPRHKWRYRKSDFRIREVHVFTSDTGGSGVVGAQFGLRRNLKAGDCVWLTEDGWQKKECSNRQWLEMSYEKVADLWYERLKQLKSSVGTSIKSYTAFSRAIDGAGNVEKEFAERRNANTFEVKRSKRKR